MSRQEYIVCIFRSRPLYKFHLVRYSIRYAPISRNYYHLSKNSSSPVITITFLIMKVSNKYQNRFLSFVILYIYPGKLSEIHMCVK
jgi:hypothetical protein